MDPRHNGVKGRGPAIDDQFTLTSGGNSAGRALEEMRDPVNFDFRPRPGTEMALRNEGAYDDDAEWYWIPGYQAYRPSRPIPPNDGENVKLDADLIFLPRRKSAEDDFDFNDIHDVYIACSLEKLRSMKEPTKTITGMRNIVAIPTELARPGKQLYWRVDVRGVAAGEEWTFRYLVPYSSAKKKPPGRCLLKAAPASSF